MEMLTQKKLLMLTESARKDIAEATFKLTLVNRQYNLSMLTKKENESNLIVDLNEIKQRISALERVISHNIKLLESLS
jgi:hypothetical protein